MVDIRRLDNTLRYDEYDEIFLIVRSNKAVSSPHITVLPELAPSQELFFMYLRWKNNGEWDQDTFDDKYVPWFLKDLVRNENSQVALNRIYYLSEIEHKRVCLLCYCGTESMCHRSIIAGLLQGVGAHVRFIPDSKADYRKYYLDYNYLRTFKYSDVNPNFKG